MVLVVKNLPANSGDIKDTGLISGLGSSPGGQPTSVFLPGEFHGQWSLVGMGSQRVRHDLVTNIKL